MQSTIKGFADSKAAGVTTLQLKRNRDRDREVTSELESSGGGASKDEFRTNILGCLRDLHEYEGIIQAVTGNDGQPKWVFVSLFTPVNQYDQNEVGGQGAYDWSEVASWVAEQLGGIDKMVSHNKAQFEDPDIYDQEIAPVLADL
ncbi:hypothetical protein [Streptomyces sp. NPDC058620]|uniref:hypothetical protein n=1 Tax=Streptomyces sp. NPDC058620 TaxID=3346560 RepID=UPI00364A4911